MGSLLYRTVPVFRFVHATGPLRYTARAGSVQEAASTVKSTSRVTLFWALLSVILISSR